ncbi:TPA: hypothetical protein ACH3X2_004019 [Trebouxia sp. C0005]
MPDGLRPSAGKGPSALSRRAKRSQQQLLAERVVDTTARLQLELGQSRFELKEPLLQKLTELLLLNLRELLQQQQCSMPGTSQGLRHCAIQDLLTRAAIAINLLGFPIACSQFLQQEP